MKAIVFIIYLTSLLFVFSCNSNDNSISNKNYEAENIDVGFYLIFLDKDGNNLLDTNSDKHYNYEDIKLVYGKYTFELTNNKELRLSGYSLVLSGNVDGYIEEKDSTIQYGTCYLYLSPTDIDTIYTEATDYHPNVYLSKVVYNSELVYELGDDRHLTIVK